MNIHLIAIGTRMPDWVEAGFQTYAKRLPSDYALHLKEIPAEKRSKQTPIAPLLEKEGQALLNARPPGDYCIALDRNGKTLDTSILANALLDWHDQGQTLSLLIGGPEGLPESCLNKTHTTWSLSALTLPHPLVRILVAEQIYRAWSILSHHPYHR